MVQHHTVATRLLPQIQRCTPADVLGMTGRHSKLVRSEPGLKLNVGVWVTTCHRVWLITY